MLKEGEKAKGNEGEEEKRRGEKVFLLCDDVAQTERWEKKRKKKRENRDEKKEYKERKKGSKQARRAKKSLDMGLKRQKWLVGS